MCPLPDGVLDFYITDSFLSIQPVTEVSTRLVLRSDNFATFMCRFSENLSSLNLLEPSDPVWNSTGMAHYITSTPVLRFTSTSVLRFTYTSALRFTSTLILHFTSTPLLCFTSTAVLRFIITSCLRFHDLALRQGINCSCATGTLYLFFITV
jgi:hypothetical protein